MLTLALAALLVSWSPHPAWTEVCYGWTPQEAQSYTLCDLAPPYATGWDGPQVLPGQTLYVFSEPGIRARWNPCVSLACCYSPYTRINFRFDPKPPNPWRRMLDGQG